MSMVLYSVGVPAPTRKKQTITLPSRNDKYGNSKTSDNPEVPS